MLKTQGHVGSTGGLRGHSVGGLYPWSIVGYGDDTWQVVNLCSGWRELRRYKTAAEALEAAEDIAAGWREAGYKD